MRSPDRIEKRGNILQRNARNIAIAGGLTVGAFGVGATAGAALNFAEVTGNIQKIESDVRLNISEQQRMTMPMEQTRTNQGLFLFAGTMLALGAALGANSVRSGKL